MLFLKVSQFHCQNWHFQTCPFVILKVPKLAYFCTKISTINIQLLTVKIYLLNMPWNSKGLQYWKQKLNYTNKSFCSSLDISATPVISIDLIWPPNRVVNWVSVRPLVSGTTIATKNTPTIKTMAWNPNKCERPKECSIQGYIFRIRATTICLTLRLTEHPTVRPLKNKKVNQSKVWVWVFGSYP